MPRYDDDQDGEAAEHGYRAMRERVKEASTPMEVDHRMIVRGLLREFNHLVHNFEHGIAVDPEAVKDKGIQIGAYIGTIQEMRAAAKAPGRELVGV